MAHDIQIEPGWFDPGSGLSPEQDLWKAVLYSALLDAKSKCVPTRAAVARWIDTPDFITVCAFAGYEEPEYIRIAVKQVLAAGTVYLHESPEERARRLTRNRKAKTFNDRRRESIVNR